MIHVVMPAAIDFDSTHACPSSLFPWRPNVRFQPRPRVIALAAVGCKSLLASLSGSEAASGQQRVLDFCPSRVRQDAQDRSDPVLLCERYVVEIQRAGDRHTVIRRKDHLSREAADRSGGWHHDDLVQRISNLASRQDQDWPTLVRTPKRVPADLASVHPSFSQPSASHASCSSSFENSSLLGGSERYAAASPSGHAPIRRIRRARSGRVKCLTSGTISSAVRGLGITGNVSRRAANGRARAD